MDLRAAALIAAALALAACEGDLPTASYVDKLRVLAVQADPPEIAPGEETKLRALAVEPELPWAPLAPLSALWLACKLPEGPVNTRPCGLGDGEWDGLALPPACGDAADGTLCTLGTSLEASARATAALLGDLGTGTLLVSVAIADTDRGAAACYMDTARNAGLPTEPDRCVLTVKRVSVSDPARAPSEAHPVGPPNRNPTLDELSLVDADGTVRSLLSGDAQIAPAAEGSSDARKLRVTRGDAAAELHPDGAYEALSLSWFTTAGKIEGGRSTFDPPGCDSQESCASQAPIGTVETDWIAPAPTRGATELGPNGRAKLWAVLRDDRGGVGWLEGTLFIR